MDEIKKHIEGISLSPATQEELQLMLSLIDLTSLEGKDNEKTIQLLCEKAIQYNTAAVCVYPSLIAAAKKYLTATKIKIASVAGAFPSGQLPLKLRLEEAKFAIEQGADEIDMVISRGKFLEGNYEAVADEIAEFRNVCKNSTLKVILETGELIATTSQGETFENIRIVSKIAINAGADFIKTSTGKITSGATLETVYTILSAIKDSGEKTGIKCSGGITDIDTAVQYLRLTENILGKDWLTDDLFRFGASKLGDTITAQIKKTLKLSAHLSFVYLYPNISPT